MELNILFITSALALLLLLLLQSRIWVLLEYEAGGLTVWAGLGFVYLTVYPFPKKVKLKKTKRKAKELVEEEKEKEGLSLELFWELFELGQNILRQFQQKLRIDKLLLFLTWGMEDPADAAVSYGLAQGAMASLLALMEVNFHVKEAVYRIHLDYTVEKPKIYVKTSCSLSLQQALRLGISTGVKALKLYRKQKKQKKETIKKAV
jgi:DNA-directed RNA polymerase subunit L